jgi:hypothetical protein
MLKKSYRKQDNAEQIIFLPDSSRVERHHALDQ